MDERSDTTGPLSGLRVVELGGIGPVPLCGMVVSDLGAEVVRVDRPADAGREPLVPTLHRGRRSLAIDLKAPEGADLVLRLVDRCDALIEGFRPGVLERLGLGPEICLARNPRLVYGRMTGWGQDGPLAQEAGHDVNYIALAGALGAIGPAEGDPVVPLNLIADMGGGGMLLALGVCAGVLRARETGQGQVVDAAMTDGTALQLAGIYGLLARGLWTDRRGTNLLDGAAPFYRTYRCADGGHVAVGCLEPQFYAAFLGVLGLDADPLFSDQHERSAWPAMGARLEAVFAERPRDEWTAAFAGHDACVTPVLGLEEAARHPHNAARGTYVVDDTGAVQPGVAPRFRGTPSEAPGPARPIGADTDAVLRELGMDDAALAELRERGVVG
ncbi:MAG TPA: CaiB/BaiF CoA-transferase family protein [Gaiella sp.]